MAVTEVTAIDTHLAEECRTLFIGGNGSTYVSKLSAPKFVFVTPIDATTGSATIKPSISSRTITFALEGAANGTANVLIKGYL